MGFFIGNIFITSLFIYFLHQHHQKEMKKIEERLKTLENENRNLLNKDNVKEIVNARLEEYKEEMSKSFKVEHYQRLNRFLHEIFEEYEPPEAPDFEWKQVLLYIMNIARERFIKMRKGEQV